ncbi:MAG: ABC transporter ATP-binding protein [Polyangiales bacterium]
MPAARPTASDDTAAPLLVLDAVEVTYDDIILALRGATLAVRRGAVVALLGGNGAGKTTTLKAAAGLLHAERGAITAGSVRYDGVDARTLAPRTLVKRGLVQVLEGRRCFAELTVEENLRTGTLARGLGRKEAARELERAYAYFPRLRDKRAVAAGYTSGGEQQMIALGRALLTRPRLMLLDEPSMGLAPRVVEEIFEIVRTLNRQEGVSFLLAEQNATLALRYADHGYLLDNGKVVASGAATALAARTDVRAFYLGIGDKGRRRFGTATDTSVSA